MGVIKSWNTVYPVAIDDLVTNFPVLVDATDEVIASHSNELAKAVVALETEQQAIVATVSGLGNVQALYNSVSQTTTLRSINFTGSGVAVTTVGNDVTVTVSTSTTDRYSDTIIVGNSAAGDTAANCHYLDPGDGTGIAAALTAAAALAPLRVSIFVKRGTYTLNQALIGGILTVPAGCQLEGDDQATTILVTYAGSAGVHMTTITLAAGTSTAKTSMRRFGISVPANGVGIPGVGARGIVNFNAYTKIEDVDAVVAAGTAINTYNMFFQADYLTAYPHGVEIRRIRHNASNATDTSLTAVYAINLRCTAIAPTTGAPAPVVEDITYYGSTATSGLFGRAVYAQCPTVDIRRVRAFNAQAGVLAASSLTYGGDVRGPYIEDVINDIRGYVGSPPIQVWSSIIGHATTSLLTIRTPTIKESVLLYDTPNIETLSLSILGADALVTYTGAVLHGVRGDGGVNGGPNMSVESTSATGLIDGVSILDCGGRTASLRIRGQIAGGGVTNARIIGCEFYNITLDGAGNTVNTILTGNTVKNNCSLSTSTVVNTLITGNRIVGTISDSGVGTSIGLNI
jgi:hypothetical protein